MMLRCSSAPTKGLHPSHYKHGLRTYKHCIVCEGIIKATNYHDKKDFKVLGVPDENLMSEKKFPVHDHKQTTTYSIDGGNFSEHGFNLTNLAQTQDMAQAPKSL